MAGGVEIVRGHNGMTIGFSVDLVGTYMVEGGCSPAQACAVLAFTLPSCRNCEKTCSGLRTELPALALRFTHIFSVYF